MRKSIVVAFAAAATTAAVLHAGLLRLQPAVREFEAKDVQGVCGPNPRAERNIFQLYAVDVAALKDVPAATPRQIREACRYTP